MRGQVAFVAPFRSAVSGPARAPDQVLPNLPCWAVYIPAAHPADHPAPGLTSGTADRYYASSITPTASQGRWARLGCADSLATGG
jgi:hypothetical protein